jgi:hypothetical protein
MSSGINKSKSDKLEKEKRIRIVQEWILQDFITTDIVNQCVNKWGVSDRQAMRYLSSANEAFAKITEKKLESRLNYHIQRRNKLLRDLDPGDRKTPAGINCQLNILQDIAKLEKLYTLKVEHSGQNGGAIVTDTTHRVIFEDYATG